MGSLLYISFGVSLNEDKRKRKYLNVAALLNSVEFQSKDWAYRKGEPTLTDMDSRSPNAYNSALCDNPERRIESPGR